LAGLTLFYILLFYIFRYAALRLGLGYVAILQASKVLKLDQVVSPGQLPGVRIQPGRFLAIPGRYTGAPVL
jgi:hypothetical protein